MAIVKGTGGSIRLDADLIPDATFTAFLAFKVKDTAGFWEVWEYFNNSTNYLWLKVNSGSLNFRSSQQFNANVDDATPPAVDTWFFATLRGNGDGAAINLDTANGKFTSDGNSGAYGAVASPFMRALFDASVGDKVGAIGLYSTSLSDADVAHLMAGNDPTDLPSATAPSHLWVDSAGIVKDGSNNLTSWTDEISGAVLSPAGTVTVDDADAAPVTYSAAPSGPGITPGAGEALVEVSNPVTDSTSIFYQLASGTIATGDYVHHTDSSNTTVNADGTFTQTVDRNFDARVWDATDETWGAWQTIEVNPAAEQPGPAPASTIFKGTSKDMEMFAAGGMTKGSYNSRAVAFFTANGATSKQFNLAKKQYEGSL